MNKQFNAVKNLLGGRLGGIILYLYEYISNIVDIDHFTLRV